MQDELKYKVISLLQPGDLSAKMIADELNLSYSSVLRVEREFEEARLNGTLEQLVNVDDVVLSSAAATLDMDKKALTSGLKGVDKLSTELQSTALQINTRVRSLILGCEHISELEVAADIICALNKAFVNADSTQVNIQNNYGGENNAASRYAGYLSDTPVS